MKPRSCSSRTIASTRSVAFGCACVHVAVTAPRRTWLQTFAATALAVLTITDAFQTSSGTLHPKPASSSCLKSSAQQQQHRKSSAISTSSTSNSSITAGTAAEVSLEPVVSDLRARIAQAPIPLEGNEESRLNAEATLPDRFEIDRDGNVVGGAEQEDRLVRALSLDTVVVVRSTCPDVRASLIRLGTAAERLLGETRTVEEKLEAFGAMRDYEEGVISGYAGGGDYGTDQFLETRGRGAGQLAPEIDNATAPDLVDGRRALSTISCGVLRAVVRQSLPETDSATFLRLVDDGEGGPGTGKRDMSSTPLRMCRYAGADGVAFGAHTDTTFLTVIPCASAPGLEILQPATGRWLRPEAARNCRPGSDVMLLAGELLQILGNGRYQAAVHRVVRPVGLSEPRVSTPLLVRGAAGVAIRNSMLPAAVTAKFRDEARPTLEGDNDTLGKEAGIDTDGQLTMKDLWAALQFRGGALGDSEEELEGNRGDLDESSPLACSLQGEEDEIRRVFGPFARDGITVLSTDPLLVRLHGFASSEECAAIIDQASGGLAESTTWGGTDAQDETDGLRVSSTTWIADESLPLLGDLTKRVIGMSGLPSTFMEKWQVARYRPQGYFNLHTDHVQTFNDLCCGGRLGTLILYLNDDFAGGQTDFPTLDIAVKPSVGDAIYFHSVQVPVKRKDAEKMVADERSAHAGLAVEGGNKWIATKWVHPLPYPNGRVGSETREQAGWDRTSN